MTHETRVEVGLRPWSEQDLTLLERLMGDPATTGHLGGPETADKIKERHQRYWHPADPAKERMLVIVLRPDGTGMGSIGYWEKAWQGALVWETGWSVLPEFQGRGIATLAAIAIVDLARLEGRHRFLHAFPSVDNPASNTICRKVGFVLRGEVDFEYPPGNIMRCNDWELELFGRKDATHSM